MELMIQNMAFIMVVLTKQNIVALAAAAGPKEDAIKALKEEPNQEVPKKEDIIRPKSVFTEAHDLELIDNHLYFII